MPDPHDIYPMPMFPALSVADVDASVSWYTNRLGFAAVCTLTAPGGDTAMAHLRWRRYADMLLVPDSGSPDSARPKGVGVVFSFLVDLTPVDEMARILSSAGVEVAEGPVSWPWNTREIAIFDPDGCRLVFFEPADTSRSFEDVMGEVANSPITRPEHRRADTQLD